jgi:hypothetical protein
MPTVFACDPLGCLLVGSKQDTLILGEVTSIGNNTRDIKINFVFPQNKIKSLEEGDQITLNTINLTDAKSGELTTGKKYLMSLNKNDNFYISAWGIYEITGNNYSDAKLVRNRSLEDKALEIFINSGGTERGFGFDYSGIVPVLIFNGKKIPESNILRYSVGIGAMVLIGGISLIISKKK